MGLWLSVRGLTNDVLNYLCLWIILGAMKNAQGRSELQNHCHELRAGNLTQSILQARPVLLRR